MAVRRLRSCPRFVLALLLLWAVAAPAQAADGEIRLQEIVTPGRIYHVETNVRLSGQLNVPDERNPGTAPRPLVESGMSLVKYNERLLETGPDGVVIRSVRAYQQFDLHKRTAGQDHPPFSLRPEVRRVVWQRSPHKAPFSPDGPMTWGELDAVRTDLMTTTLLGLLPDRPVRAGATWQARREAVEELTDLEPIEEGGLECRFQGVEDQGGRRYARVAVRGKVRGVNEDGPNRQELDGYFLFDLGSNHLSYLTLTATSFLLDKAGKEFGQQRGVFVLSRQADVPAPEVGEEALRGRVLTAGAGNTLLLYANADLGVRLHYPRRWREAKVEGTQITFESPGGAGVKLTLTPPERMPAAAQLLAEAQAFMRQANAQVLRADPPRSLRGAPQALEHFALEVQAAAPAGQPPLRIALDYYLLRQPAAGATAAAQVPADDKTGLRQELERMMLSLTLNRPVIEKR